MMSGDDMVVRHGRTTDVLGQIAAAEDWLSSRERQRAASFRIPRDRDDFVASHALARICAGQLLDMPPSSLRLVQRCSTCGGGHGRPTIVGMEHVHLTLSHSRGWVAAAAATRFVGVDVERIGDRPVDDGVLHHTTTEPERRLIRQATFRQPTFLTIWVLKESLVKAGALTLDRLREADLAGCFSPDGRLIAQSHWQGYRLRAWYDGDAIFGSAAALA
jgi:4'-phosphopantetheinyl transferase